VTAGATTKSAGGFYYVSDGREACGFVVARGKSGYEAFATDETSLGLFESAAAAATECWRHAHGQRRGAA
jgi:hypothetical protein